MVHCKNLSHLQEEILLKRQVYIEHLIKLRIDGSGGFLKVSLGIKETEETSFLKSPSCGHSRKPSREYDNIKTVLGLICPENVDFFISCDLKVVNILCALQSHAGSHPCTYCDIDFKTLSRKGQLRTFGSIHGCFEKFKAALKSSTLQVVTSNRQNSL